MTKNRLETSYESSLKPSYFTLQCDALRFQLSAESSSPPYEIMFFAIIVGFFAKSPTVAGYAMTEGPFEEDWDEPMDYDTTDENQVEPTIKTRVQVGVPIGAKIRGVTSG